MQFWVIRCSDHSYCVQNGSPIQTTMTSIRNNYLHKHLLQTPFYRDLQCAYYLPQHSVSSFQRNQCNHQRRLAANKRPRRAGLIFVLNNRRSKPRKWLKTGIELINGKPHLSTVFKNRSTDRSLFPVPSQGRAATLKIAREPGTSSLWVYHVEED